jgi:flavodoxin
VIDLKKAVVFYSKTGNTDSVARQFKDFDLLEIVPVSDNPEQKHVEFKECPDISGYEHLVFAGPVHGFSLCKVMKAYIDQLGDLSNLLIDTFITHHFRFAWLGGLQALKQMRKHLEAKQGQVRYETSINWKSHKREVDTQEMIEKYNQ